MAVQWIRDNEQCGNEERKKIFKMIKDERWGVEKGVPYAGKMC